MRERGAGSVLAGVAWVVLCAPLIFAADYAIDLGNPGFEEAGKEPPLWAPNLGNAAEGNGVVTSGSITRDGSRAHSGEASAHLRSDGPRYARLDQVVKLDVGAKYRLSVWVNFSEQAKMNQISLEVRGRLEDRSKWNTVERPASGTLAGEWNKVSVEFTVPEKARGGVTISLRVLFANGPVEAWFDDVELVQLSE